MIGMAFSLKKKVVLLGLSQPGFEISREGNVRSAILVHPFVILQVDLHNQQVSLRSLRVLYDTETETDVLVIECFELPLGLLELARFGGVQVLR